MQFLVYNTDTSAITDGPFKTNSAAKASITRASKKHFIKTGSKLKNRAVAEEVHYYKSIEKMVTRKNMMTGKEYQESINTPISCSPASETYWSM
jgi:hypothetical protein